jgi:hypothetical protein
MKFFSLFAFFFIKNNQETTRSHYGAVSKDYTSSVKETPPDDNSVFNKQPKPFFHGQDMRYNTSRNETEYNQVVMNITKFMEKMELLKKLENKNIDDFSKQLYIEEYKKRNEPISYGLHVENGDLFTDWDFTLDLESQD